MSRRARRVPLIATAVVALVLPLAGVLVAGDERSPASEGTATRNVSGTVPTVQAVTAAGRASRVMMETPTAQVGEAIEVRGRILVGGPGRTGRKVRLRSQEPGAKTWANEDGQRTDRRGTFALTAAAPEEPGRLRIQVYSRGKGREKDVRRTVTVTVVEPKITPTTPPIPTPTPTPTGPLGDPNDWTYINADQALRRDSCQTITWSYDPAQQPYAEAGADIVTAVERVAAQTGYTFVQEPVGSGSLEVDWKTPEQVPALAGTVVGLGGPAYVPIDPALNGGYTHGIVGGIVTLDASAPLPGGFGHHGWGQVMLHEIGHALGLGHAAGKEQVMAAYVSPHNVDWGAGDLTGLGAVGATGKPCIVWNRNTSMRSARTVVVAE